MLTISSRNNLLPDAVNNVVISGRLHLTAAQVAGQWEEFWAVTSPFPKKI